MKQGSGSASDHAGHGQHTARSSITIDPRYYNPSRVIRDEYVRPDVPGYRSWAEDDPRRPTRTSHSHYNNGLLKESLDLESPEALSALRQRSLYSEAAAIQDAISLANGEGLLYEWDDESDQPIATEPYGGSKANLANDNRKRPGMESPPLSDIRRSAWRCHDTWWC